MDLILFLLGRYHARLVINCLLLLYSIVTAQHGVVFLHLWLQWTSNRTQTLHPTWWMGQVLPMVERCRSTHRLRLLPNRGDRPIVRPRIRAAWDWENRWPLCQFSIESTAVSLAILANLLYMVIKIGSHEHLTTVATLHPYSSVCHFLAVLHQLKIWIWSLRFRHLQHTGFMGRLCTLFLWNTLVLDWQSTLQPGSSRTNATCVNRRSRNHLLFKLRNRLVFLIELFIHVIFLLSQLQFKLRYLLLHLQTQCFGLSELLRRLGQFFRIICPDLINLTVEFLNIRMQLMIFLKTLLQFKSIIFQLLIVVGHHWVQVSHFILKKIRSFLFLCKKIIQVGL